MTDRRTFIVTAAAALVAMPAIARPPLRHLFDGRTLNGWVPVGEANWAVRDGALSADTGPQSFLVTRDAFRDFELRAEFWVSAEANSGIFIRCTDPAHITATNAYEVNIFDTRPDPDYATGAIVGVAKVSPMPRAGGRWNVMMIVARGDSFTVALNGVKTVDAARDGAHAEGPIALQYGAGVVKFRKVDIRLG